MQKSVNTSFSVNGTQTGPKYLLKTAIIASNLPFRTKSAWFYKNQNFPDFLQFRIMQF